MSREFKTFILENPYKIDIVSQKWEHDITSIHLYKLEDNTYCQGLIIPNIVNPEENILFLLHFLW